MGEEGPGWQFGTWPGRDWDLLAVSGVDVCGHGPTGWLCRSPLREGEFEIELPDDVVAVEASVVYAPTAYHWGLDSQGTLWRSDMQDPVAVGTSSVTLAAAGDNVCGVTAAGGAECWFQGSLVEKTGSFVDVAVGDELACGAAADGAVACWDATGSAVPAPDARLTSLDGDMSGRFCGLNVEGALGCWFQDDAEWNGIPMCGRSEYEFVDVAVVYASDLFDIGACGRTTTGVVHCFTVDGTELSAADRSFDRISAEASTVCGLGAGMITCWGDNL